MEGSSETENGGNATKRGGKDRHTDECTESEREDDNAIERERHD